MLPSRLHEYMVDRLKKYSETRPRMRKVIGWSLVVFGFVMLVTPLTPGGVLFFVGLEVLGIRFIGAEKVKAFITRKKERALAKTVLPETVS